MKVRLVKVTQEARGTKSFFWEPEHKIKFLPGQYFYYTIPKLNYPDERGATRHFTIASSPTEGNLLRLTTRIREDSGYKKTLNEIKVGDVIEGEGPTGTFIFDEKTIEEGNTKSHVFLAGGIGITPFRCMIKYVVDKKLNANIHLIYSNSDSDFTYKKELEELDKQNDNLKIDYFDSSKSGHLNEVALKNLAKEDLAKNTFWVVGPPGFVNAMESVLEKLKIASSRVITEKFTGY